LYYAFAISIVQGCIIKHEYIGTCAGIRAM